MHETMVAQNLLAAISREAAKHNAKPVAARISCGTLYAVNDELLRFAFEAIARDTPCEGVRLEIEHKRVQGRCRSCNETFDVELSDPRCRACAAEDFELLPDPPLVLEQIELRTE
ncbi:MAG: hydrogenase maturation nickel metallochaperone HypA [Phycisphaerales bacterium]|nr:MAG: hydrogenase maturation nickel metallochaperone HypA [Phycisphaerales bacterium]